MRELFVKICGITNRDDALYAIKCRADALGFVFDRESPHFISPIACARIISDLPSHISKVGVFAHADKKYIHEVLTRVNLSAVQLDGKEGADDLVDYEASVIKVFHAYRGFDVEVMRNYIVDAFLFDALEDPQDVKTNPLFCWHLAVKAKEYGRIILWGGLTPENIEGAVQFVRPYGVNVNRGVESEPGSKDPKKIREFIARAKGVILDEEEDDIGFRY